MDALEELLAKQAIVELVCTYAHAIDRCDCGLPATLFTPDAMLNYGLFNGSASDLIAQRRAHGSAFLMTHLQIGNVLVHIAGETARAQNYLSVVHRAERDGGPRNEHVRASYLDRIERHHGRWLFVERTLVFDWAWGTEADRAAWWDDLGSGSATGSRTDDPSRNFGFLDGPPAVPRLP